MVGNTVHVKVISLKQPCTACLIIDNLLKETLTKLHKEELRFDLEIIELDNLKQVGMIPGLEVEKLPALLIDDEQVTAGSLPTKQQLTAWISAGGGNNVKNGN